MKGYREPARAPYASAHTISSHLPELHAGVRFRPELDIRPVARVDTLRL